MLDDARIIAPELENKKIAGYCNWHHVINRGDRLDCINGVQLETIFLEQPDTNRTQSWQNNAGFFYYQSAWMRIGLSPDMGGVAVRIGADCTTFQYQFPVFEFASLHRGRLAGSHCRLFEDKTILGA